MDGKTRHSLKDFGDLYEKYAPSLIFFARKYVTYNSAEDIVHDVFLKLWKIGPVLGVEETVPNYLFQAVRNNCLNYLKHQFVEEEYVAKVVFDLKMEEITAANPETVYISREQIDALYSAIDQLPEKCREVFLLSFRDEMKNKEIAEHLQISVRTVESHLYKAILLLRKTFTIVVIGGTAYIFPVTSLH